MKPPLEVVNFYVAIKCYHKTSSCQEWSLVRDKSPLRASGKEETLIIDKTNWLKAFRMRLDINLFRELP